jgi:hypothetical protein
MHRSPRGHAPVALAAAVLLISPLAHATEEKVITNAHPASAASAPDAKRTLKMTSHHAVPANLTVRGDKPVANRWQAQFRFAGQTDTHDCEFNLPKLGQVVQPGTSAVGTITCTTPWQLYDNGLAFEAFQSGKKVADGTLRP